MVSIMQNSNAVEELLDELGVKAPDTVDGFLNEVDYTFPDYIPSAQAVKFIEFIKLVNMDQGGEENLTPIVHYKMLDSVFEGNNKRTAIMCHRGIGKTTLMAEYMILYIALFGKLDGFGEISLILYVSDSIENGVKNLRKNLEHRYENSAFLKENLPIAKFTDVRCEFINLDGHKVVYKGYGAKTGVRGAKEMGIRPQLAILDDLISDEDARSKTVIDSVKDTVYKAVSKALHPKKQKTIWLGTPFNQSDPLYEAVESGAWKTSVYPICEKFDSTTTEDSFQGSWSDRFGYDYVKDEYETARLTGTLDGFNQELMLRIMSQDNRLVQDDDLKSYSKALIPKAIPEMNVYITTDFATTDKESSDYTVISVWGHTSSGEWMYLDGICRTQLMDKTFDDLFRFVSMYSPMSVGIEASGQQYGFITLLHKEMAERKNWFTIAKGIGSSAEGIRPKKDKLSRFMTVLPDIKAGKFFFPTEIKNTDLWAEIYNELSNVSASGFKSKHDDFVDTMNMLYDMPTIKPVNHNRSTIFYNQETGELEQKPEYLEEEKNSYIF